MVLLQYEIHHSIIAVKKMLVANSALTFKNVSKDKFSAIIKNLDLEKASKSSVIPTRILKKFSELFPDFLIITASTKLLTPVLITETLLKS